MIMDLSHLCDSNYSLKLLKCRKCFQITSLPPEKHPSYNQCFTFYCSNPNCMDYWYICKQHSLRFASYKFGKLRSHFTQIVHDETSVTEISHNICKVASSSIETIQQETSDSLSDGEVFTEDFSMDGSISSPLIEIEDNLPQAKRPKLIYTTIDECSSYDFPQSILPYISKRFFDDDIVHPGHGVRGLVGRSFRQNKDSKIFANQKETNLQLHITHFCSSLTQFQQHEFAAIISAVISKDIFNTTRPPMSYHDITKFYTSSQHSIYQNIPSPKVFEMDGHACVNIEDVINHMLSFGIKLNTINIETQFDSLSSRTDSIQHTKEVEDIIHKIILDNDNIVNINPIIIYVILWSDDFEANHTRKNRNSTWIKTITICPPQSHLTSPLYTYPIAIGRKGQCHDSINNYFNEELKNMSKCTMRYCSTFGKLYPVIVKPLCISADRPERSSLNFILSHNGSSTKRWMYSELIPRNKLPSCISCFTKRWKRIDGDVIDTKTKSICNRCCDWEMLCNHNNSNFFPPTNYPTEKHPESPPAPIDRDICKPFEKLRPIKMSYDILLKATKFAFWNYLHGVWKKSQTHSYFRLVGISTAFFNVIVNFADNNKKYLPVSPSILDSISLPAMWTSIFRLEQCIDTPMHLLFQGITKSIIDESKEFMKYHKVWSKYGRQCNLLMNDISKNQIDFCKIECFNGGNEFTTGGWIAETYLAYARISSVLSSHISEILPPSSLGLNEFQCMIQSMFCLISRLMTNIDVPLEEIKNYTKLFLSCCSIYYSVLYESSSNKNPFWNSPNFLSLLNLPEQIKQFGTMRLHWEGVHERFIQHIKPHLKNMRTTSSYLCKKLDDIHKGSILKHQMLNSWDTPKQYQRFRNCKRYKSLDIVQTLISTGLSLVGVLLKVSDTDLCFGILLDKCNELNIIQLNILDEMGFHLNNLWFAPIEVENGLQVDKEDLSLCVYDHIVIIPMKTFDDDIVRYTIIGKSWHVRNSDGKYLLPTISSFRLSDI